MLQIIVKIVYLKGKDMEDLVMFRWKSFLECFKNNQIQDEQNNQSTKIRIEPKTLYKIAKKTTN